MNVRKFAMSIICFTFLLFGNVYAITYSSLTLYESTAATGYSKVENDVYFNQLMNLENLKVKFTQDKNNYIFHITGNSSINISSIVRAPYSSAASSVSPMLYRTNNFGNNMYIEESGKAPFASYIGALYSNSTIRMGGVVVDHYEESYKLDSERYRKDYTSNRTGTGARYYIPNSLRSVVSSRTSNYRNAKYYPSSSGNNGTGVTLLQNSSSCNYSYGGAVVDGIQCVSNCYFNINTKIAIAKSYIDDYRYICFAQSYSVAATYSGNNVNTSIEGLSFCSPTIDLKEYAECDHNWIMRMEDRENHTRYCENCEWEINEPHELLYEYDGIKNNICPCAYIDKVNYYFKINDDFTSEVKETFDSDAEYTKHEFQNKTGYKFKHYDVYEKQMLVSSNLSTTSNALKTVFKSTASELPDKTGTVSLIYEARYEPNRFTIYYSNKNNKQIELGETIEPQTIEYDETAYLKKNIHHVGYVFKGWSLVEGGESIDLEPLCEVTNYTATDGYRLELYPVYTNLDFKIVYSAGGGYFLDGSKYKEIEYSYYDDKELETVCVEDEEMFFKWFVDDSGNIFKNMSDIKKFVEQKGVENITLNLFPRFGRFETGSPERTDSGGGPGGNVSGGIGGPGPGYELLPEDNLELDDNPILDDIYVLDIVPFSNSETNHNMEDEEEDDEGLGGAVVASLSFVIKRDAGDSYNKWDTLLSFIKNNLFACILSGVAILILLIIYEIIVISRFRRRLQN